MGRKPVIRSEVEKQKMKVEARKKHQHNLRRAMAVSDYLLLTATDQHRQATEFVDKLEEKYPGKRDVRKTVEFREWQRKQLLLLNKQTSLATDKTSATNCETALQIPVHTAIRVKETEIPTPEDSTTCQKEMVLRIPLMHAKAKETPPVPVMPGEEDQLISIFDEIPTHVMNEMMAEIRADPELNAIMNDFDIHDEVLDEGTVPGNMDIDLDLDIEIGDPLEDELNSILYF